MESGIGEPGDNGVAAAIADFRASWHDLANNPGSDAARSQVLGRAATLADAQKNGATLAYGHFITLLINFLIVAWVLFMVVKAMNRLKRQPPPLPAEPPVSKEEVLLAQIRDLLAARK